MKEKLSTPCNDFIFYFCALLLLMTSNTQDNLPRRSNMEKIQIPLHLGMGFLYIVIGLMVLYIKYFGSMALSSSIAYFLGSMLLLYGCFRIWRGITMMRQQTKR